MYADVFTPVKVIYKRSLMSDDEAIRTWGPHGWPSKASVVFVKTWMCTAFHTLAITTLVKLRARSENGSSWAKPHGTWMCSRLKRQQKRVRFFSSSSLDHPGHLCPAGALAVLFSPEWLHVLFSDVLHEFASFVPHSWSRFLGWSCYSKALVTSSVIVHSSSAVECKWWLLCVTWLVILKQSICHLCMSVTDIGQQMNKKPKKHTSLQAHKLLQVHVLRGAQDWESILYRPF